MRKHVVVILCMVMTVTLIGCAAPARKAPLTVTSNPPGALVSFHSTGGGLKSAGIAGQTPLTREFDFQTGKPLWIQLEKRGFAPRKVNANPAGGTVAVTMEPVANSDGSPVAAYRLPQLNPLVVVTPDFTIIQRGFSSEAVAAGPSEAARQAMEGLAEAEELAQVK